MQSEACRSALIDRLCEACGVEREALSSAAVLRCRATDVRFVPSKDGDLVIKTYRPETSDGLQQDQDLVSREFEILERLEPLFDGKRWGVVEPVKCLPEFSTLVTRRVPGDCISTLLDRRRAVLLGTSDFRELLSRYRDAGGWLRELHTRTAEDSPVADVLVDLPPYIEERVRSLSTLPAFASKPDLVAMVLRRTAKLIETLSRREGETVCLTHHDYSPGNIFHDGTTVTVIDFFNSRPGVRWQDLVWFRIMLDDKFENYGMLGRRRARQLWRAFVDGYGEPVPTEDDGFELFLLKNRMITLTTLASRLEEKPASLSRLVDYLGFRRQRKWLLDFCRK